MKDYKLSEIKEITVIEETKYCEETGELVITRFDVVEEKADETDKVGE